MSAAALAGVGGATGVVPVLTVDDLLTEGAHVGVVALALFIAVGSLVPVLPTGALVSASAAVALGSDTPVSSLVAVFAFASVGAFVGDTALYAIGLYAGGPALHRLARRADPHRLAWAQHELSDHSIGVLTVSRLLPAGRIPVLVASVLVELPWRRFLAGNVVAVVAWALIYMVLGTIGAAIFPSTWEGVLAAIVLVMIVATAPAGWHRLRVALHRPPPPAPSGSPEASSSPASEPSRPRACERGGGHTGSS